VNKQQNTSFKETVASRLCGDWYGGMV